jgi:ABC-type multidrug transport system permease subunit
MNKSKQQSEEINFTEFNKWYVIFQWLIISIAVIILIKIKNTQYRVLFLMALYYTLCNAFVTGALANIINRLNTKGIIVLICISLFIIIDQIFGKFRLKNRSSSVQNSN